jgi:predicted nucleic acid-binding protein
MIVVADTSPINYLILIEEIEVLAKLYSRVAIPPAVRDELLHPRTPQSVKTWIEQPPIWLEVRSPSVEPMQMSVRLDPGETAAMRSLKSSKPTRSSSMNLSSGRRRSVGDWR